MKKLLTIFMISTFLLTGCVQSELGVTINKDKSVVINNEILMDNKIIKDNAKVEDIEKNYKLYKENYENIGYTFAKVQNKEMQGFNITKDFGSLEELSKYNKEDVVFTTNVEKESSFFYETYKVEIKVPGLLIAGDQSSLLPKKEPEHKATFKVSLPYKSSTNNATKVDGKELIWTLDMEEEQNNVSFSYNHYHEWVKYLVIGLGLLFIFIIGFFIYRRITK